MTDDKPTIGEAPGAPYDRKIIDKHGEVIYDPVPRNREVLLKGDAYNIRCRAYFDEDGNVIQVTTTFGDLFVNEYCRPGQVRESLNRAVAGEQPKSRHLVDELMYYAYGCHRHDTEGHDMGDFPLDYRPAALGHSSEPNDPETNNEI